MCNTITPTPRRACIGKKKKKILSPSLVQGSSGSEDGRATITECGEPLIPVLASRPLYLRVAPTPHLVEMRVNDNQIRFHSSVRRRSLLYVRGSQPQVSRGKKRLFRPLNRCLLGGKPVIPAQREEEEEEKDGRMSVGRRRESETGLEGEGGGRAVVVLPELVMRVSVSP